MTRSYTQKEFDNMVWQAIGCSYDWMYEKPRGVINQALAKYILRRFCNHWGEKSMGGWKMAWQKQKTFDIKRRLNTFIENSKDWDRRKWQEVEKNPQGLKAPVIKKTPEQIEESARLLEVYKKRKEQAKTKVQYRPKPYGVIRREEVRQQQKSKEQSEQKYTDYE